MSRHDRRGHHKSHRSPETRRWEEIANADWLRVAKTAPSFKSGAESSIASTVDRNVPDTKAPPCPPWLDRHEYEALCELRKEIL